MDEASPDSMAGLQLLRPLRDAPECRSFLAHLPGEAGGAVVVVRRFVGREAVDPWAREAAALERGAGEHVVPLLDVAGRAGDYALVLERIPGPTLSELVGRRTSLALGEIVTTIAPLARTVVRLHARGVAHGRLVAGNVVLDAAGAPTLVGFGAATLFTPALPEARLELEPAVVDDREALRRLALGLLGASVRSHQSDALDPFVERLRRAPAGSPELMTLCSDEIFAVASPAPISADEAPVVHSREHAVVSAETPEAQPDSSLRGALSLLAGFLPDEWIAALTERLSEVLQRVEEVRSRVSGRRRLVVLCLALAAILGATGVWAIPPNEQGAVSALSAPTEPAPVEPDVRGGPSEPGFAGGVPTADDPLEAARQLLTLRDHCLRDLAPECLSAVNTVGSPAEVRDAALIAEAIQAGSLSDEAILVGGVELTALRLVNHLGGSAVVEIGDAGPTVLLMAGEDGWRIRDVLPAAPS